MPSSLTSLTRLSSYEGDLLVYTNTDQQKNLITTIDRWALKQPTGNRAIWKKISDYGEIGIFHLPGLLMIDKNICKDWLRLLFMYVEGHTVTFTFYNYSPLGPHFQNRCRPAVYCPELGADTQQKRNNRNSFYSGHVNFTWFGGRECQLELQIARSTAAEITKTIFYKKVKL